MTLIKQNSKTMKNTIKTQRYYPIDKKALDELLPFKGQTVEVVNINRCFFGDLMCWQLLVNLIIGDKEIGLESYIQIKKMPHPWYKNYDGTLCAEAANKVLKIIVIHNQDELLKEIKQ